MNSQTLSVLLIAPLLIMPVTCFGGGVLHMFPPKYGTQTFVIARPVVLSSRATITVSNSSIETITTQTFHNDNEYPVKGLYLLPIDATRQTDNLEIQIDGVVVRPQELTTSKALAKLEKLVRRMRDPSWLSFAGMRLLVIEPITMSVNGKRTITVKHTKPISRNEDSLQIRVRLDGERHSLAPVEEMEIRVRFKMSHPVSAVLSPSHHMKVFREAPHRCTCVIKKRRSKVREDLRLIALFSHDRLAAHVLTHKRTGRTGTFMVVVAPSTSPIKETAHAKDVVLVLDSSGSMSRINHAMAKEVILACIRTLRPRDRFNIINISTRTDLLADRLIRATDTNLNRAERFIEVTEPDGGTDLYNALVKALLQFNRRKRMGFVVVAADGGATVGVTNPRKIVNDLAELNKYRARIFALAFGRDAKVPILSKLTEQTGGALTYMQGQDGVSSILDRFLAQLSLPQASKISLEFQGVRPLGLIPNPIPDIYRGDTRVVLGRYAARKNLEGTVTLKARIGGSSQSTVKSILFPRENLENPYLPAIWAMRKLGKLLERKELDKNNQALKSKIQTLADQFGFRFPLIQWSRDPKIDESGLPTKAGAVTWLLKTSLVASDIEAPTCRRIGGKVFCREGAKWVDKEYRPLMLTSTVTFLSKDYFDELETDPGLGAYYALGPDVIVVRNGKAIAVQSGN